MKKETDKASENEKRLELINYIYKCELLNCEIDLLEAFEKDDFSGAELEKLKKIKLFYPKLIEIIKKNLTKTWVWERVLPLERAILIVGAFQLTYLDKAVVINEMVKISKEYILDDKYKFINAILQKIGDEYDQKKSK